MASSYPCDVFVALPPITTDDVTLFAKNAGYPKDCVHEVVYFPTSENEAGTKVQCTHIEVEHACNTNAVLLCRVAGTWGADMGANEKGVCIGNSPVDSTVSGDNNKLTGQDLVRLGLERGNTAKEALDVITSMVESFGTAGSCCEGSVCQNSYMIADRKESWVLETAGKEWAAEQIKEGVRNISNGYTIHTKQDAASESIKGKGDVDFAGTFQAGNSSNRYEAAKELINKKSGSLDIKEMIKILRDQQSGVCQSGPDHVTVGSMVSILSPEGSSSPCIHLVTATPDPCQSVFKPFVFTNNASFANFTVSSSKTDPKHELYRRHELARDVFKKDDNQSKELKEMMLDLEQMGLEGVNEVIKGRVTSSDLSDLFEDCVDSEMKFY